MVLKLKVMQSRLEEVADEIRELESESGPAPAEGTADRQELDFIATRQKALRETYRTHEALLEERFDETIAPTKLAEFRERLTAIATELDSLTQSREALIKSTSFQTPESQAQLAYLDEQIYTRIEEGNFLYLKAPPNFLDKAWELRKPLMSGAGTFFTAKYLFGFSNTSSVLYMLGVGGASELGSWTELSDTDLSWENINPFPKFFRRMRAHFEQKAADTSLLSQSQARKKFEFLDSNHPESPYRAILESRCRRILSANGAAPDPVAPNYGN